MPHKPQAQARGSAPPRLRLGLVWVIPAPAAAVNPGSPPPRWRLGLVSPPFPQLSRRTVSCLHGHLQVPQPGGPCAQLLGVLQWSSGAAAPSQVNMAGTQRSSSASRAGRNRRGRLRIVRVTGRANKRRIQERIVMANSQVGCQTDRPSRAAGCQGSRVSRRSRGADLRDLTQTIRGDHEGTLQQRRDVAPIGVAPARQHRHGNNLLDGVAGPSSLRNGSRNPSPTPPRFGEGCWPTIAVPSWVAWSWRSPTTR